MNIGPTVPTVPIVIVGARHDESCPVRNGGQECTCGVDFDLLWAGNVISLACEQKVEAE